MQIEAPSELKTYLKTPFSIAKYQCLVHANNRCIETNKGSLNYYDLTISGHTNKEHIEKNALIEVLESYPPNILKQLSFYNKCKTIDITKETYDYVENLAVSIADANSLESIAKPAIDKTSSNCKHVTIPWSIHIKSKRIHGKSICLIATKDIPPQSTLLYEQNEAAMLEVKRRLLNKYPVVFDIDGVTMTPKHMFDAPVKIDNNLINFTTLDKKTKYEIAFDTTLNAYETKMCTSDLKRRKVFLKKKGNVFQVNKIENPSHLK